MSYAGFDLSRKGYQWIARRRTRTAIYQLAPAKTLREIEAAIDKYNAELSWEELTAA